MMDIDNFKQINDRYGHRTGDEILNASSSVLLDNIRGCDLASRYGGDEFIIVLPETPATPAWSGAERIRKMLAAMPIQVTNQNGQTEKVDMTLSIGIAEYPTDANSAETLIDLADKALYQAKRLGSDQTVRFQKQWTDEQGSI